MLLLTNLLFLHSVLFFPAYEQCFVNEVCFILILLKFQRLLVMADLKRASEMKFLRGKTIGDKGQNDEVIRNKLSEESEERECQGSGWSGRCEIKGLEERRSR